MFALRLADTSPCRHADLPALGTAPAPDPIEDSGQICRYPGVAVAEEPPGIVDQEERPARSAARQPSCRRPALSSCSTSWRRFPIPLLDVAESEAVESLPSGPRDASEAGASRHPEGAVDPSDVQVYDLQLDARDALFFENRIFRTAESERPCVKSSDVQICLPLDEAGRLPRKSRRSAACEGRSNHAAVAGRILRRRYPSVGFARLGG
jgi:hypothetical protein